MPTEKITLSQLESFLFKSADILRGKMDASAGVLKNNIDVNAVKGKTKIPDQKWKDLLDHINQPRFILVNDNFEFPDLLGAASSSPSRTSGTNTPSPAANWKGSGTKP